MNADTFMQNFGHLADAPGGMENLREMVLQLAVLGKLVSQDPNDEPAAILMERAAEEKQRLISEGQLRKAKPAGPVTDEERPFEIPSDWTWTRLHDAGIINPRNSVADDLEVSFTPMTLISDQYGEPAKSELQTWGEVKSGFTHFAEGDVVMAKITPCFQNRKSAVMCGLRNGVGAGTTELHVFRPLAGTLLPEFVLIFLKSHQFIEVGITKMTGSAGQKRVPKDYFAKSPFPVPPLAEQVRIVAKVDELMALCDELEARQQERRTVHVHLNNAALDRLTSAENDTDFKPAWTRIRNNFDLLYSVPENVNALRQAILQLAVQGKLVPQDPNDEPADKLVARITEDKRNKPSPKGIRAPVELKPVDSDEIAHSIPINWHWTRLGTISHRIIDGNYGERYPKKSEFLCDGVPFLTSAAVGPKGDILYDKVKYISTDRHAELIKAQCTVGDVLLTNRGARVGAAAILADPFLSDCNIGPQLTSIRTHTDFVDPRYVLIVIQSPSFQSTFMKTDAGTAMNFVNLTKTSNVTIPLAPLPEQHRIVAKVDELMALCDELESKLTQQQTDADRLTEAMVAAILDGAAA